VLTGQTDDLVTAEIGDAAALKVGHIVLALGPGPSASWGVISALDGGWRTRRGGHIDPFVRLDLTFYPGFSGGPLVDVQGRVVGINTSGLSRHMQLAIPASTVTRVVDELLKKGHITRGYLGLGMQPVRLPEALTRGLEPATDRGLIIVNVEPDGPAARAGLLIGDVLVVLAGVPVGDTDDVQAVLGPERVGSTVGATLVRAGAPLDVSITVGERPERRR